MIPCKPAPSSFPNLSKLMATGFYLKLQQTKAILIVLLLRVVFCIWNAEFTERESSSSFGSLPGSPASQDSARPKPRTRSFSCICHVDAGGLLTWAIFCFLPKKLDWKWSTGLNGTRRDALISGRCFIHDATMQAPHFPFCLEMF